MDKKGKLATTESHPILSMWEYSCRQLSTGAHEMSSPPRKSRSRSDKPKDAHTFLRYSSFLTLEEEDCVVIPAHGNPALG